MAWYIYLAEQRFFLWSIVISNESDETRIVLVLHGGMVYKTDRTKIIFIHKPDRTNTVYIPGTKTYQKKRKDNIDVTKLYGTNV